jgi:starch synthase
MITVRGAAAGHTIRSMRLAFIAAECEPWAKTGGLGDVVDALARALGRIPDGPGELVDVFLPRYRNVPVPPDARDTGAVVVPDPRSVGGRAIVNVLEAETHGYRLRLIDHPPAFDRADVYGFDDDPWRFGLFSRAALEVLRADAAAPDVIHVHDWHACPAILYRDLFYRDDPLLGDAATMLTIHNLAYQGWIPRKELPQLGLDVADRALAPDPAGLDLLWAGIERADLVNTVSPGFAREALTPEGGFGLDGALRWKSDRFFGILNGIDAEVWNPATDGDLPATYDRSDRSGKAVCRSRLLAELGLDPDDAGPVIGMIGRLDHQKGFDILAEAADRVVIGGARLIVLGSGDARLAERMRSVAEGWPDRIAFVEKFDRALARRIYAGADFFLMPSRFEPCGTGQMISMRYGTPPIVHRTGGLRDTVVDETTHPGEGTGFVFDEPTPDRLLEAVARATDFFPGPVGGPSAWEGLLDRAMAVDFDWERSSAPAYVAAYRRAIDLRRSSVATVGGGISGRAPVPTPP